MVLWLRRGDDASLRVAVVASRKVGGAVARARAKRLLREVYRRERANLDGAYDVVLVARRAILTAEWPQLIKEMRYLAKKAGLVSGRDHQKAREVRAEGRQEAVNGEST
jgi:ribonuclease P protein component